MPELTAEQVPDNNDSPALISLLAIAEKADRPLSRDKVIQAVDNPNWDWKDRDWRLWVMPESLRDAWPILSLEARVAIFVLATYQEDNYEWGDE